MNNNNIQTTTVRPTPKTNMNEDGERDGNGGEDTSNGARDVCLELRYVSFS